MSEAARILAEKSKGLEILVLGDLMVDQYLWGDIHRISPEAPVPVVDVRKEESRPGGAANVALNLAAMQAKPVLCGLTGVDAVGDQLIAMLEGEGFDCSLIFRDGERRTTCKTRIVASRQQVARVDREDRFPVSGALEKKILEAIAPRMHSFAAVIFEDYNKGFLQLSLIQEVIKLAEGFGIPVIVDPKFLNFLSYSGCTVFKPNTKELSEALGQSLEKRDTEGITHAVESLRERMPHRHTVVTLSEEGMLVFDEKMKRVHLPAHYRKITDVSGAGDTVAALLALGLATGLGLETSAAAANLGGGLVCEDVGVVPVNRDRLIAELSALPS